MSRGTRGTRRGAPRSPTGRRHRPLRPDRQRGFRLLRCNPWLELLTKNDHQLVNARFDGAERRIDDARDLFVRQPARAQVPELAELRRKLADRFGEGGFELMLLEELLRGRGGLDVGDLRRVLFAPLLGAAFVEGEVSRDPIQPGTEGAVRDEDG